MITSIKWIVCAVMCNFNIVFSFLLKQMLIVRKENVKYIKASKQKNQIRNIHARKKTHKQFHGIECLFFNGFENVVMMVMIYDFFFVSSALFQMRVDQFFVIKMRLKI